MKKMMITSIVTLALAVALVPAAKADDINQQQRDRLMELQKAFYQFVPQYAKYDMPKEAASARVQLDWANEQIIEKRNPEDAELALNKAEADIQKLRAFPVGHIEFDFAKADVRNPNDPILKRAAMTLKESPRTSVLLSGHTDSIDTNGYNRVLGMRRAQEIREWLLNDGVNKGQVKMRTYGEDQPIATNQTEIGRQYNRRIEFENTWEIL